MERDKGLSKTDKHNWCENFFWLIIPLIQSRPALMAFLSDSGMSGPAFISQTIEQSATTVETDNKVATKHVLKTISWLWANQQSAKTISTDEVTAWISDIKKHV